MGQRVSSAERWADGAFEMIACEIHLNQRLNSEYLARYRAAQRVVVEVEIKEWQ